VAAAVAGLARRVLLAAQAAAVVRVATPRVLRAVVHRHRVKEIRAARELVRLV